MDLRSLPPGHWVVIRTDGAVAAAAWDDPVVPHWRRVRDGKPRSGDVAAVAAWLAGHATLSGTQLALWQAA